MEAPKKRGNPNFRKPAGLKTIPQETNQNINFMEQTVEKFPEERRFTEKQLERDPKRKNPKANHIEDDKVYEFELIDSYPGAKPIEKQSGKPITSPYPPMYSVPNEGTAYDESYDNGDMKAKGRARSWRLIDGQTSIWVDEQVSLENLEKQEIYNLLGQPENQLEFKEGKLLVRGIERNKIQALMVQDSFEGKKVQYRTKNRTYRLNNPDLDVSASLDQLDREFEAMKLAMEADDETILRVSYILGINIDDQSETGMRRIRQHFITKAKPDPKTPKSLDLFVSTYNSPLTKLRYVFSQGLAKGIISANQQHNRLTWAATNTYILDVESNGNVPDLLTGMCVDDMPKAMALFEELQNQLNNLDY